MSILSHSTACCTIPPLKENMKISTASKHDVTGSPTAKKALLVIYDIFGYFPQTIQGADILPFSDEERGYQVFMPDFFEGQPADLNWYPPDTQEKGAALTTWFSTRGPQIGATRIPEILPSIEALHGPKTWGAIGFCWGGKVISMTTGPGMPFKAPCQAHPGMIDPADAAKIVVLTCMLASRDENAEEVRAWGEALRVEKRVETFGDQVHWWMSARGDLEDERVRKEYERWYGIFWEFPWEVLVCALN